MVLHILLLIITDFASCYNTHVNVNNIFASKLFKTNNDSKYSIGYLDDVIKPLALALK